MLCRLRHGFDSFPVHGDVREDGRRRYIHVPQRMVDQLKVPFALSGLQVHADEAFSEEIVSRPMPAVEIAGWRFYRQVDESKLLVHSNLRPHAGVAGVFRRAFFPGVVAKLAFLGNGVENPEPFAGAHVESAHVAFVVAHALRSHPFAEGRADDHRVFRHHRGGLNAHFSGLQVGQNLLIVILFQVHNAVFAKRRNAPSGLRVQTNQAVAGGHIKNALFVAVGPVRQPAPGKLPRSRAAALPFVLPVYPQQFAGLRIQRNHRAPRSRRRVKNAIHHQWCAFELVFRPVAEIVCLHAPGNFEVAEIGGIDLIQRPVTRARDVCSIRSPFRVLRMPLSDRDGRNQAKRRSQTHELQTRLLHFSWKHFRFLLKIRAILRRLHHLPDCSSYKVRASLCPQNPTAKD